MTPSDLLAARLAQRQLGLATRHQLLAGGLTRRQVDGRISSGRLLVVHENVYRVPEVRPTYEQAVLAACLATGGVASHRCAARLFHLRGFERYPAVEICVDRRWAPELVGVVAHRSIGLLQTKIGAVPVAMPAEVLLQVAAVAPGQAAGAVNDVLCRSIATLPGLVRFLQRRAAKGRNGTSLLRDLVAEQVRAGAPTESWLEDRLLEFVRARGYPEPVRQHWRRLFHTSPRDRRRDAGRDAVIAEIEWVTERVTWLELVDARHGRRPPPAVVSAAPRRPSASLRQPGGVTMAVRRARPAGP